MLTHRESYRFHHGTVVKSTEVLRLGTMTKQKQKYLQYLESEHWRELREQAFRRDGYKCCHCGSTKKLRGHHIHYSKDLRNVPIKHILTLCEFCHTKEHRRLRAERRKNRKPRERIEVSHLTWIICAFGSKVTHHENLQSNQGNTSTVLHADRT